MNLVNFTPVKHMKASDEIGNQLKNAIFEGKYVAGDKLPSERELIELFQISRTVVREAIKGLEASGLVEIKQGAMGGAFVKLMTFERLTNVCQELFIMEKMSFAEVCEARLQIEPMVAKLAAQNCTPEMAEKLREASRNEEHILDYPDTVYLRQKVHYILADMSGNRFLAAIVKSLLQVISNATTKFEPSHDKVHPAGLHDGIIEAVIAQDGQQAEAEMREHLQAFTLRLNVVEKDYRDTEK
ncbi:FadR/GntR family transcriptional regulator [Shewanella frigidimarina]|jgi:GntR family transcriptional repressor for pyruvate dehydrogenase complex|uniref:Transcriptional regulator, GntR family n=2 Tax=Shewanella frigidimarina TaxID=56812 RepID=Q07WU2_SHEFN|nr:FadR/GntR family transcriptional regulator [Shewanella sp. SG44-2]ABI73522.1 transcriptional regulator, GntR family [Shewanella frigidimarina NCIMB 400]|tara:strand:+ start:424 stop:1149 length:726 start_codon:yes stop_codon:yes gene_type:complete